MIANTLDTVPDQEQLLGLARELDRVGRHFERFVTVQLEQLQTATLRLQREQAQWERQRDRDFRQLEQNRHALQELWQQIQAGTSHGADVPPLPDLATRASAHAPSASATDPVRILLRPGRADEMQLGRLLLELLRLTAREADAGRLELIECRQPATDEDSIAELHMFPTSTLARLGTDEASAAIVHWQQFKSALVLMPVQDASLPQTFSEAVRADRKTPVARLIASAKRRAEDAVTRTSERSASPTTTANTPEQLADLIRTLHEQTGLAVTASLL